MFAQRSKGLVDGGHVLGRRASVGGDAERDRVGKSLVADAQPLSNDRPERKHPKRQSARIAKESDSNYWRKKRAFHIITCTTHKQIRFAFKKSFFSFPHLVLSSMLK